MKTLPQIRNDFQLFRSAVPLKRAQLPHRPTEEVWSYYQLGGEDDAGSHDENNLDPLIFLPGATTSAESFFYQLDALSCKGYRCVGAHAPPYYSVEEWIEGFDRFLDTLKCQKCHIFGRDMIGERCLDGLF